MQSDLIRFCYYKGLPTEVKYISTGVNRKAIDHGTTLEAPPLATGCAVWRARGADSETTNVYGRSRFAKLSTGTPREVK